MATITIGQAIKSLNEGQKMQMQNINILMIIGKILLSG